MSHGAPLAVGWLLQSPREQRTYMAAFNLMSLHMRSQQGKGMPALLIPLHWPYISAGCQSRGLHPERLRRQKQLDEKTDRRACLCLSERVYLKNASYRLKIIAQLWNDQMLLFPFLHMNIYCRLPCYFYMRKTKYPMLFSCTVLSGLRWWWQWCWFCKKMFRRAVNSWLRENESATILIIIW